MASLDNVSSTWGNSWDQHFLSTCGCISLSLTTSGHSWWGNASTCAEEKLIPRIASYGKVTLFFYIIHSSFCQFQANLKFWAFFSLQLVHWWWKMHYHCIWKGDFHNNHWQKDTGGRGLPNSKEVKKLNKLEWIKEDRRVQNFLRFCLSRMKLWMTPSPM